MGASTKATNDTTKVVLTDSDGNTLVTDTNGALLTAGTPFTGDVNFDGDITKIGGDDLTLGQKLMAESIPVVLASDQAISVDSNMNLDEWSGVAVDDPIGVGTSFAGTVVGPVMASVPHFYDPVTLDYQISGVNTQTAVWNGNIRAQETRDNIMAWHGMELSDPVELGISTSQGAIVPGTGSFLHALGNVSGDFEPLPAIRVGTDTDLDGFDLLGTTSVLYDGFGIPIGSVDVSNYPWPTLTNPASLLTASTMQGVYGANSAQIYPIIMAFPSEGYGTSDFQEARTMNNLAAVGGVATVPGSTTGSILTTSPLLETGSLVFAQSFDDGTGQPVSLAYPGRFLVDSPDGFNAIVAVTSNDAWGGAAVAAAVDLEANVLDFSGGAAGPMVGSSNLLWYSGDGAWLKQAAGVIFDQGGGIHLASASVTMDGVNGYFLPQLTNASYDEGWIASGAGFLTDGADEASMVAVSPTNPLPVSTTNAFNSNLFVATGTLSLGTNKLLQNYTAQAIWQGSVGADTFTATLEGSYTGSFAGEQVILATMTESSLTASVTGKPYPYTRVNLSALSLDTATGLTINAAGMQ